MSYNSTMQHFFLNPESIQNGEVTFPEDLSRQIKNVLRLKAKTDAVIVLDNSGWEYLVQLTGAKGQTVTGRITGKQPGRPEPTVGLRLCYSLTRREKMEVILQKATEIGVTSFQPYISSRSLVQDERQNSARQERLLAIMREAAEQSMRSKLPILQPVLGFEAMLTAAESCSVRLIAGKARRSSAGFVMNCSARAGRKRLKLPCWLVRKAASVRMRLRWLKNTASSRYR